MANEVVGRAVIKILPDTTGFTAALQKQLNTANLTGTMGGLGREVAKTNQEFSKMGHHIDLMGKRSALVGQAFTYGVTRPIMDAAKSIAGVAIEFDKATKTISAITIPDLSEDLEEFEARNERYRESARRLAKDSVFSANEIADGMLDLARAGLTTVEQLEAVIPTVSNIALVEGGKMADFSDTLVQIFTGFGGSFTNIGSEYRTIFGDIRSTQEDLTKEFQKMGDILALTSQRTTTDIKSLGDAFRYAGPTAAIAGVSFEESAAALGVLAQSGFQATVGGTGLRGIITRLAVPTQVNEKLFDKFGISVENAFAPMENAAESTEKLEEDLRSLGIKGQDLKDALAAGIGTLEEATSITKKYGLQIFDTEGKMIPLVDVIEQFQRKGVRVGDAMKLFGQRAGPAFLALSQNLPFMKQLNEELEHSDGTLGRMAERMKTTADSQLKMFKNALVEVAIALGDAGLLDRLVETAQWLRQFTYSLMETNPEIFKVVAGLALLVAAVGPVMQVFGFLAQGYGKFLIALSSPIGIAGLGIAGVVAIFLKLYESSVALQIAFRRLLETAQPVFDFIKDLVGGLIGSLTEGIDDLSKAFGDRLAESIRVFTNSLGSWIRGGGIVDVVDWLYNAYKWVNELADAVRENLVYAFESLERIFDALLPLFEGFARAFIETIGPSVLEAIGEALSVIVKAFLELLDVVSDVLSVLKPLFEFLGENGEATIVALAAAFLLLSRNYGMTLGAMKSAPLKTVFNGFEKMAYDIDRAGSALTRGGVSEVLKSSTVIGQTAGWGIGLVGDRLSGLATRMINFGARLSEFNKNWLESGKLAQTAINGIQGALLGLLAGNMIAKATDLQSSLAGIGTAAMGILIAFGSGGPAGVAMASITTLITLITMLGNQTKWASDMGKSSLKGFQDMVSDNNSLNDYAQSLKTVTDTFNQANNGAGSAVMDVWLRDIGKEVGNTKLNLDEYVKALTSGEEAMKSFREEALNSYVEVQKRAEIDDRGLAVLFPTQDEVDALLGAGHAVEDYMFFMDGGQKTLLKAADAQDAYNNAVNEIDTSAIRQKALDENANIKALYGVSDAALGAIESERVLGDLRNKAEADALGLTDAQYQLKTAFDQSATAIDNYRAALHRLTDPVVDPSVTIDNAFNALSSFDQGLEGKAPFSLQMLDPSIFGPENELGRQAREFMDSFKTNYMDVLIDLRMDSSTEQEFQLRVMKFNSDLMDFLTRNLGLSRADAEAFIAKSQGQIAELFPNGILNPEDLWETLTKSGDLAAKAEKEKRDFKESLLGFSFDDPWSLANKALAEEQAKKQAEEQGKGMVEGASFGFSSVFGATTADSKGGSFIGRALGLAVGGGDPKSVGKVEGELAAVNTVNSFRSKVNELLGSGVGSTVGKLIGGSGEDSNGIGVSVQIRGLDVATTLVQNFLSVSTLAFQAFGNVITSTLNLATLAIVGFVNRLSVIPGAMRAIAFSIAQAFRAPIAFAAGAIWPPFALLMRGAAAAFGINSSIPLTASIPSVPAFHTGGVVGDGSGMRRSLSDQRGDEVLAMLKKGEGVLPADVMARMARADFEALRKGEMDAANFSHGDQIGGPYESGRAAGSASGMRGAYFPTGMAQAAYGSMSGIFSTMMSNPNVMARVVGAAIRQVGDGFMEWIRGAGDAASEAIRNQTGSWPPGYIFPGGPRDGDLSQEIAAVQARMGQENSFPAILEFLEATGVPFRVTSTLRNTLVRGTGRPSLHNVGRAVDLAEVGGFSRDSPGLLAIYRALDPIAGFIRRIYSGPGGGGAIPGSVTWDDHHDHVHVSLARGGIIRGRTRALLGEVGDEVVIPLNDPRRAMSLALNSGLFNLLSRASGPTSSAAVPGLPSATSRGSSQPGPGDPGFLGGGPGNTYHIYGVGLDQVKAEVKARDEADMRKVRR